MARQHAGEWMVCLQARTGVKLLPISKWCFYRSNFSIVNTENKYVYFLPESQIKSYCDTMLSFSCLFFGLLDRFLLHIDFMILRAMILKRPRGSKSNHSRWSYPMIYLLLISCAVFSYLQELSESFYRCASRRCLFVFTQCNVRVIIECMN